MSAWQAGKRAGTAEQETACGQLRSKGISMPAAVPEKKQGFLLEDYGRNPT